MTRQPSSPPGNGRTGMDAMQNAISACPRSALRPARATRWIPRTYHPQDKGKERGGTDGGEQNSLGASCSAAGLEVGKGCKRCA